MAAPAVRYLRRLDEPIGMDRRAPRQVQVQQLLLLDSGRLFMLLGAMLLMWQLTPCDDNAKRVFFTAFLLWTMGAALAVLSVVARQFPRPSSAVARALRGYFLGGL